MPLVPEIRIHKAAASTGLRRLADADTDFTSPYWAHYWGGGLVLARYILDHPHRVAGKRVLDLGTGSGLVAIAAALAGAGEVMAADIDPYAVAAARLNAQANGVSLRTLLQDPTREDPRPGLEIVTAGDLFYEPETAKRVERFLRSCAASGADVLIGDPWRAYLPVERLEPVSTLRISEAAGALCESGRECSVFVLKR